MPLIRQKKKQKKQTTTKNKNTCAQWCKSGDTASYVGFIWVWFFSTYTVSVEPFQCNVLFLCVFVVSFFPLFPSPLEQHPVPYRQEGEPGSFQFGRAHDHVSFSCAIPTHPISKTTSQFHQPYSYSLPPLQRSAGRPGRPGGGRPAESGRSALRVPLSGLSGPLCHPRHLAWPGAPAAAWSARWVTLRQGAQHYDIPGE